MQTLQPTVRRRRIYKGRSKLGCRNCKQKHIRCDEAQPHCKNCFKSGLRCDGPIPPPATTSNPVSPRLGFRTGAETFQLFVSEFAPLIGGSHSYNFWLESVCPMAEYNPGIHNAVMALSTLWDIPQSQILFAGQVPTTMHTNPRYQTAIEWYDRSLSAREKLEDCPETIIESLVLTILYMHIEYRLGHRHNTESLARTAFAIIHSYRMVLEGADDPRFLSILEQLLRFVSSQIIDSTIIPREHHLAAMTLGSQIVSQTDPSDTFIHLTFEFHSIAWDLNNVLYGLLPLDPTSPGLRLDDWYQKYAAHQQALSTPPFYLDFLYHACQIRWHVHLYGHYSQRQLLENHLLHILDLISRLTQFVHSTSPSLAGTMVWMYIAPLCVFVAWNWREDAILARINAILSSIRVEQNFVRIISSYIDTIVTADYHEGTFTELKLFGQQPRILQGWHIYECAWDLLKQGGLVVGK